MLRRLLSRPYGPSLRGRIETAQLGIVPTPPELETTPYVPGDPVREFVKASDAVVEGLQAALAAAEQERDVVRAELGLVQQQLHQELTRTGFGGPDDGAVMAERLQRINELGRELEQVKLERDGARQDLEAHLADRAGARAAAAGLDLTAGLQTGNQRLRAQLRTETDRADRAEQRAGAAETRIAGLELTVQLLAQAHTGQEKPRVVVVDGAELVVPWSRA